MKKFAYDAQLQSIPEVVSGLLKEHDYPKLNPQQPIIFTGIGTSLHAARVAADWVTQLSAARVRAWAVDAHDLGTEVVPLQSSDQVIVISHRGTKVYPTATLSRASQLGCFTIAIVGDTAPKQTATVTLRTCANETAGTFSVSYLASLVVLARLVATTFPIEAASFCAALHYLPTAIEESLNMTIPKLLVENLTRSTPILISGFGLDLPTAQEAALKIKEGAWLWTEAMSPEFALHGTPASYHADMSAIVMMPPGDDGGRSQLLMGVLKQLGLDTVATCGEVGTGADLTFCAAPHPLLRPFLAILPFHILTAELARLRSTDPDTLHGHREPWKTIMSNLKL